MQIQVNVVDSKAEVFLNILSEFKNSIVKNYHIISDDIEFIGKEEERDILQKLSDIPKEDKEIDEDYTTTIKL